MSEYQNEIRIGDNSVAIYDTSGQVIAHAKEVHSGHNLLEVEEAFRGQGYATKILNILEEQVGEKETERSARTSSTLFYIKRGFFPYRKIKADPKNKEEMETCFHDEEIETERMSEAESLELITLLKRALKDKEEFILPFPVLLRKNKNESNAYQMFLKRNLKKAA